MNEECHSDHGQIQNDWSTSMWLDDADPASTTGDDDAACWEVGIGSIPAHLHSNGKWDIRNKYAHPLEVIRYGDFHGHVSLPEVFFYFVLREMVFLIFYHRQRPL